MDRKTYVSVLAALATAATVWLFIQIAAPIAKPLAWALIIGIPTLPHHDRLVRRFPAHPDRSAGLMVLAITVCLIVPIAVLVAMLANNAADWYTEAGQLIRGFTATGTGVLTKFPFAGTLIALGERFGLSLSDYGAKLAGGMSAYILEVTANTARNLGEFLFTLAVALFMLFFIYRDGENIVRTAIARFAADRDTAHRYLSEIRSTTTAVTIGTILTCLVQGAIAGLGYFVAGVPAPVFFGALTVLAAIVPVVGTGIVWVPIVILVAINGAYFKAVILLLWCVIFVSLADNAIRPLAIGAKGNIPVTAVVLGAICGVSALGILGLILGPILFALLITLWRDATGSDKLITGCSVIDRDVTGVH